MIHDLGMTAGATLNPATPTVALCEAARYADLLLCMSVNPGWGGQEFIEAIARPAARAGAFLRPGMGLQVDGGVGPATIARCREAGANLLVAGSAIFHAPDPGEAYRRLTARSPPPGVTLAPEDERWLERTLELAERGRRTARPNPVVGCVIVRDGLVLGEGWHVRKYENHAEGDALARLRRPGGATAYVCWSPASAANASLLRDH